jgi:phospholipid/cholesterol/gamma-HCH transport system permease protein
MSARRGALVVRLQAWGGFMLLAGRTAAAMVWPPLRLRAVLQQIYLQGVRALGLAAAASLFTGMAMALQFGHGLARFGAQSLLPQLTALGLFRELMPVMVGLVIGGRLGAGIAAEMATMAVTEQLDALRTLGADPVRELVAPRVAAAAVVLPLVVTFGDVVGLAGALTVSAIGHGLNPRYFLHTAGEFLMPADYLIGVAKSAGFGAMIALTGCWHGGRATGGADGVGRATTQTVVQGALAVIVADYFISRVFTPILEQGPAL